MWSCGCSFTTFFLFLGTWTWTWTQCTQYPVPCHDFFRDKKFGFLDKPGTQVPRYLGTLGTWVPGYLGTWVPGYLGTWVPGYLGTWVPGYLGTWVPGYLGKHVRFCSRKHVHFFAITRILFVYVLSQIEKKSIRVIAIYPKNKKGKLVFLQQKKRAFFVALCAFNLFAPF